MGVALCVLFGAACVWMSTLSLYRVPKSIADRSYWESVWHLALGGWGVFFSFKLSVDLWKLWRTRVIPAGKQRRSDSGENDASAVGGEPPYVPVTPDDSSGVRLVVSRHTRLARASFMQYWQMELGCVVVLTLHALALLPVWAGLLLLIAYWIVAGLYRNLATRVHFAKARVPEGPVVDGLPRRACYGNPDELEAIAQTPHEPFEPVIVQVSTYDCLPGWFFVPAILAVGVGTYFLPGVGGNVVAAAAIALAVHVLGRLAGQIAWPTYYRVVPGRLEVLRYSPFRRVPALSRTVLLRDAMIVCDLGQRYLTVLDHADAPQGLHFDLWRVPEPLAFAQAVFRGATVAADAPALPEDELLG